MTVRIDASAANLRASFSDDVRPSGAGAIAGAVSGVAQDLAQMGLRLQADRIEQEEKQQRQQDAVYLAKTSAAARIKWAKQLDDDLKGYDGAAGGFADGYLQRYGKDSDSLVAAAPERVRAQLQVELLRQGEVLGMAAVEGESGRRQEWTLNGINEAADVQAEALVTQPDLYQDAVDSLPGILAAAPEGIREKLGKEKLALFASSYAEGLMAKDPQRLVDEIDAGLLDPSLDAKAKATWRKAAEREVDQRNTAMRNGWERLKQEQHQRSATLSRRAVAYIHAGMPVPKDLMRDALDAAARTTRPEDAEAIRLAQFRSAKEGRDSSRTEAKAALDDLGAALKLGLVPSDELVKGAADAVAKNGSIDLVNDLTTMAALAGKQQEFAFATNDDLQKREREIRAAPATRETTKELEMLQAVRAGRDKAIADDNLVGWAATYGVPLVPLQANDPNLGEAVAQRAKTMAVVAKQSGAEFQFFGKDERVSFARQLDQMAAEDRLRTLGTIAGELGPDASIVLGEISKSGPRDAQAGMLLMMGRTRAAGDVVAGAEALKKAPTLAPNRTKGEAQAVESQVIGRGLPPGLQNERTGILDAAGAIYAVEMQRRGTPDGEFDASVWGDAIQSAAGRDGERGGFGTVNGARILLPPQLKQKDVEELIGSGHVFGKDWFRYSYGDPTKGQGGGPPAWKDPKTNQLVRFPAEQLKGVKPVTVAPGLYWLSVTDPAAGAQYVLDLDTGAPFVLDLRFAESGKR